jgi:hypothetical protein
VKYLQHSFGGVPDVLRDCKSSIFVWKILMTSPIFETCSSMVASITNGASRISLYNFWTTTFVFYAIFSASSISFKDFSPLSSVSFFTFIDLSTFSSTSLFSCRAFVYFCYVFVFLYISLINFLHASSTQSLISWIIPTFRICIMCVGICDNNMFR